MCKPGFEVNMNGKIMVLFDSLSVRKEALEYAIELARRTDSSLVSLFLIDSSGMEPDGAPDWEIQGQQIVGEVEQRVRRAGLEADAEIRTGNPSSELMKFLADYRSPRAIVWGGKFSADGTKRHRDHWLSRIKDRLGCPVVVPARKT
jgi:nucleotide-binding universal stress UspA family protein